MNDISKYDLDFYAWANEQADLLRAGRLSELDVENVAEEIASLGRSEKRELVSRLAVLLLHLLKWEYQPAYRGKSWQITIVDQRRQIIEHLAENPSLKPMLEEVVSKAYGDAVLRAERETCLLRDMFPWACTYSIEQILDGGFWPEPE